MFENENNKKNTWEKYKIDIEIKIKTQIPNDSLFFDFSNTLKQIKDKSFSPKTSLKTCC